MHRRRSRRSLPARPARQRGHDGGSGHLANPVVVGVGDIHHARGAVDRHASGTVESCGAARPVGVSGRACQTRQRRHDGTRRDLPDRVIVAVRHIQDTRAVDGNPPRLIESRGGASPIDSPDEPGKPASVVTTPPAVMFLIVWLLVSATYTRAGGVHGHAPGVIESRGAARAVGASAGSRQARKRRHHAAGRNLPDRVIEGIGDIHVARAVDGGSLRTAECVRRCPWPFPSVFPNDRPSRRTWSPRLQA